MQSNALFTTQNAFSMNGTSKPRHPSTHLGDETDVDVAEVALTHFELKLPESLNEGHSLDIPDSATQLRRGSTQYEVTSAFVKQTDSCYMCVHTNTCTSYNLQVLQM